MSEVSESSNEQRPQTGPEPSYNRQSFEPEQKANAALGIVGIIISVLGGLFGSLPCLGLEFFIGGILALMGIVMGAIYLYQASQYKSNNVMGIFALALGILAIIWLPVKYWIYLESVSDGANSTWNVNSGGNNPQQSSYSYGVDSTEVDEELEDIVEDIVEDEEDIE